MSTEHERVARIVNATEEERAELHRVAASMAPSLTEFLLARIAEDERRARAAADRIPLIYNEAALRDMGIGIAQAGHIARWDPARVLAECEAKRRIVAWHRLIDGLGTEDNPVRGCGNCIASGAESPYLIAGPCLTLRLLALPYAGHPDYREEWRP